MVESSYLKRDVERNTFIQPINEMVKSPAKLNVSFQIF